MRARVYSYIGVACAAITVLAAGCLERNLAPLNPCLVSGVSRKVAVNNVDKVDLLFMVDNSNSMADKQESLKAQFPKLIHVLTSGERFAGDPDPFPPAKDIHVGVVTSDMGTPGFNFGAGTSCNSDGGDDGKLQHTPHGTGCDATYPTFLEYSMKAGTNADKFANDFQCIASVGTGGCGFEEQLEAPLKALWPSVFTDTKGQVVVPNPITFLSTSQSGTMGRGDIPVAQGGNLGFLRNDPATGLSLIAIVVVTDEEDCSVRSTDHLKPPSQLPADSPYAKQDINLRCFLNPQFSYDVIKRYATGFKLLRQGNEQLVVFGAITGVPPDLVKKDVIEKIDFTNETASNQFYDNILANPAMQEVVDPASMAGMGNGNLTNSCVRTNANGKIEVAKPPRRIVTLAKQFGANGVVQSICQDDFGAAMDAIINVIARQLGAVCLPRPLVRKASGLVGCNVVWELPPPNSAPNTTPTTCGEKPFLNSVGGGRATTNDRKGNNCTVSQLPVTDTMSKLPPPGDGWYYDTFTDELFKQCNKSQQQRVAFTPNAKPPTGVIVKLECLNETQRLANTQKDVVTTTPQPEIGSPCGIDVNHPDAPHDDAACIVTLNGGGQDTSMYCHPSLKTCVKRCESSTQCPAAWVCDKRSDEAGHFCVNPTCGADNDTTM